MKQTNQQQKPFCSVVVVPGTLYKKKRESESNNKTTKIDTQITSENEKKK